MQASDRKRETETERDRAKERHRAREREANQHVLAYFQNIAYSELIKCTLQCSFIT